MTMRWSSEYETGDKTVDLQHMRLFALVNELNDAVAQGCGDDAVTDVLVELKRYVKSHFSDEEALMERHSFGSLPEHHAEHVALTARVEAFAGSSEATRPAELCVFLYDWLVGHIREWDMPMIAFVRAHSD